MNRLLCLVVPLLLAADWPQWRGPNADGVSRETGFPTEWGPQKNVKWKTPVPGAGNSSPVVIGNDVILTATSGRDHSELHVLSYDRDSGKLRWERRLTATPADAPFSMFPPERGHAASTAVATSDAVFALFGTGDVVCLARDGTLNWMRSLTKDYGIIRNDYGIAASPMFHDGKLLVQIDHLAGSYLAALDATSGRTLWKVDRTDIYDNWSTPVFANIHGETQVIALGTKTIVGYDLKTGQARWKLNGLERLCSCTPSVQKNRLYAMSGPSGATLAVDLEAKPTPKILWQSKKISPFVPSAVIVVDLYFMATDQGAGICLDLKTGTEKWRERLVSGRMRPSPVAAGGLIYFTALDGTTVVKAQDEFDIVATNKLGEDVAASAAFAGGAIFIRGEKHLWCIGSK